MKRILLALTIIGCLLPLAPRAQAQTDVSLNFFYDNLSGQGNWIEVGDYGYCFQPNVAVGNSDWRPYSDGYWAYTDVGWTWVSYEDFGWATYHYGRWTNLENYGWLWVPGYEWGPAWVSWRTGGDYIGWAPLPPSGHTVYQGQAITGGVDVEFGIGPLYYNFVDIRYVGEPVLRGRILAPSRNVTIINQTVNVTNITYSNSTVYNYGPDYNRLNQYSTRPIQRLSLQRETSVGANFGQGQKGNFNRVSGNQLTVVAPTIQKSQQQIAPKQVKAKVQQPKVERGWQGVQNRQQLEAEMKQNNRQKIAPPSFQPQKERKREPVAGAEKTADRETQAPAEPKQNAGSDTDARDQQAQQSDQTAQGTEAQRNRQQNPNRKNRRGEPGAAQENATQQGGQEADRQSGNQADQSADQTADREQKPDRQQKAEGRAQRKDRDDQNTTPADRNQAPDRNQAADRNQRADRDQEANRNQGVDRNQRVNRNQSVDGNNRSDRAQNPRKAQPAERPQQPDANTPDENRGQRREKADGAPRTRSADRDEQSSRSNAAQPSSRPERSQRPQQNRRPEQARPQEKPQQGGNENPDNQRKNKKKKPDADQPPQG